MMCSPWQQQCCAAPGHLTDLASLCHYSGQPVIAWAEISVTAASPLNSFLSPHSFPAIHICKMLYRHLATVNGI